MVKRWLIAILSLTGLCSLRADFRMEPNGAFTFQGNGIEAVQGTFSVLDGESGKPILLKGTSTQDGTTFTGDGIVLTVKPAAAARLFRLDCLVENRSGRERRLEPRIILSTARHEGDRFYDGFNIQDASSSPIRRLGVKGKPSKHIAGALNPPFPVAALFDETRTVFAGQLPDDWTSYNASQYLPKKQGGVHLIYSQRLVPGKGQRLDFRFVVGAFKIRFGAEENIVQSYYDAFPERFRPVANPDNWLLRGAHSHYRAWRGIPDPERERRYFASIEWCYAPFKRSGDPVGRDEFWEYQPLVKVKAKVESNMNINGRVLNYFQMSAADFRAERKKIFDKWGERLGYAYYTCPGWCEEQLAREKYPDSINDDTGTGIKPFINGWVQQHDREIRTFPMGTTSIGKAARRDIRELAEELNLKAFTLDCGASGVYYRGPAAKNPESRGRAWDEKGLFIDELVGANDLIDYVHSLNPKNPIVVWKNGPGMGDMKMIETSIFNSVFRSWMPQTRYNAGMRPVCIHSRQGYMVNDTIPNWRQLSRDEFYREFAKLGDHAVLTGFRYGVTQSDRTCNGNPQIIYCMPELLELIRLGWQPLFPVEDNAGEKFLYRARYGLGADTVLFLGNPWEQPMPLTLHVDNRELGRPGTVLFCRKMRDHAELLNRVKGTDTVFTDTLPVRRPALYEAVCSLGNAPEGLEVQVSSQKELNEIRFTLRVRKGNAFRTRITPRWIAGFAPGKVLQNGKELQGEAELKPGQVIEIRYASTIFHCKAGDILSFPFTDASKTPAFAIVLPKEAESWERREAEAIQDYFRFTADKKITRRKQIPLLNAAADTPAVIIARGTPAGISRKGNQLIIRAQNGDELRLFREKLTRVMDEKYPWIFPFNPMSDLSKEIFQKFEMGSRTLPWSRCFESEAK